MPHFTIDAETENQVKKMWRHVAKELHLKWQESASYLVPDVREYPFDVERYFRYAKQTDPVTGKSSNVAVTASHVTGKWVVEVLTAGDQIDVIM